MLGRPGRGTLFALLTALAAAVGCGDSSSSTGSSVEAPESLNGVIYRIDINTGSGELARDGSSFEISFAGTGTAAVASTYAITNGTASHVPPTPPTPPHGIGPVGVFTFHPNSPFATVVLTDTVGERLVIALEYLDGSSGLYSAEIDRATTPDADGFHEGTFAEQ